MKNRRPSNYSKNKLSVLASGDEAKAPLDLESPSDIDQGTTSYESREESCASNNHHYLGHRKRLKEKFLKASPGSFTEYELLELLLFLANPRKDVKPLAKELLKSFGSFARLIHTDTEKLLSLKNIGASTVVVFKTIRESILKILKNDIESKVVLQSWNSLIEYLKCTMGYQKTEEFRVLYLNTKNILIAEEVHGKGTINQAPVYPREILKKALFHEASAIILVHNHPSGNPTPSETDIEMTKRIIEICSTVNILVHDHVIISENNFFSFKSNLLI